MLRLAVLVALITLAGLVLGIGALFGVAAILLKICLFFFLVMGLLLLFARHTI